MGLINFFHACLPLDKILDYSLGGMSDVYARVILKS